MTNAPKIIEAIPFVVKKAKLTLIGFFQIQTVLVEQ